MRTKILGFLMIIFLSGLISCSGNSSTEPDTSPPASPTQLSVDIDHSWDGEISLNWIASTDQDISIYRVYRSESSANNFALIDSTILTSYKDVGLDYDTEYFYQVTAVDNEQNESAPSNTVNHTPYNLNSPASPQNVMAIAHNRDVESFQEKNIIISWSANTESDFYAYVIFRDTIPGFSVENNPDVVLDSIFDINSTIYTDNNVEVGITYFYRIVALDKGGKTSNTSNTAYDTPLNRPELYLPAAEASTNAYPFFSWEKIENPSYQSIYYKLRITEELGGDAIWSKYVSNTTSDSVTVQYDGVALTNGTYYWKVLTYSTSDSTEFNSNSASRRFYISK